MGMHEVILMGDSEGNIALSAPLILPWYKYGVTVLIKFSYYTVGAIPLTSGLFSLEDGSPSLEVQCSESEETLLQCSVGIVEDCVRKDAAVICQGI